MKTEAQPPTQQHPPAYKQFWPWFLFGLPGSVVIAGIVTLFIANHAVNDHISGYKKVGLAIVSPAENNAVEKTTIDQLNHQSSSETPQQQTQ